MSNLTDSASGATSKRIQPHSRMTLPEHKLPGNAFKLLSYLRIRQGPKAKSWPSIATMQLDCELSRDGVNTAKKCLVENGYLMQARRFSSSNVYMVLPFGSIPKNRELDRLENRELSPEKQGLNSDSGINDKTQTSTDKIPSEKTSQILSILVKIPLETTSGDKCDSRGIPLSTSILNKAKKLANAVEDGHPFTELVKNLESLCAMYSLTVDPMDKGWRTSRKQSILAILDDQTNQLRLAQDWRRKQE